MKQTLQQVTNAFRQSIHITLALVLEPSYLLNFTGMPLRRKGLRDTGAIVISSSSETSEASEDGTPESDPNSLSSHGRIVDHDASARQTWKVKDGSFGMFRPGRDSIKVSGDSDG